MLFGRTTEGPVLVGSVALAAPPSPAPITDASAVKLLRGHVLIAGDRLGSPAFQTGVRAAQRSGVARVEVLTGAGGALDVAKLRASGVRVFVLGARLGGTLVIVRNTAVLLPTAGGWRVWTDAGVARSVETSLNSYRTQARELR